MLRRLLALNVLRAASQPSAMSFIAGQCFRYPLGTLETDHVWVVATSPNRDGEFIVVNFTSLKGNKDQTVILQKGDHPTVKHPTAVYYAAAEMMLVENLSDYLACGSARMEADLSPALLKLVQDGFSASCYTKNRIVDFVKKHK